MVLCKTMRGTTFCSLVFRCVYVWYEWEFTTMAKAVLNNFMLFWGKKVSCEGPGIFTYGGPWGQKGWEPCYLQEMHCILILSPTKLRDYMHALHLCIAFSRRFYPKRLTLHSSYSFTFDQLLLSLGIEPMILALLAPCSTIWATGKPVERVRD